jgi:hypothetical protein
MLLFTWVGVFCGLIFWRLGDGLDAARNRVNLVFCVVQLFMLLVRPRAAGVLGVEPSCFGFGGGPQSSACRCWV